MMRFVMFLLGLLAAGSLALVLSGREAPLTARAGAYAQEVSAASAATYVTLRTLNAVLSTAQEIELSGGFVVGGSAQPLRVLKPVDDTVERIAGVVFALMVVTGVLAVAMGPVGGVGWAMVLLAVVIWGAERLIRGRAAPAGFGRRLTSYGLFLALALPLSFVLTAALADRMTDDVWERHTAVVERITDQVGGVEDATGGLRAMMDDIERYTALMPRIFAEADTLIASYVAILAVFVFKIFVLPGLILGAFFVLSRWMAAPPPPAATAPAAAPGPGPTTTRPRPGDGPIS